MKVKVLEDKNGMYLTPKNTLSHRFIDARLFKSNTVANKRIEVLSSKMPSLKIIEKEITSKIEAPFKQADLIQKDGNFKMALRYTGYRDVNDLSSGFSGYATKKVFKYLPTMFQIFDDNPILFTTEPEISTYCWLEENMLEYFMNAGALSEWKKFYFTAKDIDDNFDAMMSAFKSREFVVCGFG